MREAFINIDTFATAKNIVIIIDTIMKLATSVRVIYRFDILLYYRLIQYTLGKKKLSNLDGECL